MQSLVVSVEAPQKREIIQNLPTYCNRTFSNGLIPLYPIPCPLSLNPLFKLLPLSQLLLYYQLSRNLINNTYVLAGVDDRTSRFDLQLVSSVNNSAFFQGTSTRREWKHNLKSNEVDKQM